MKELEVFESGGSLWSSLATRQGKQPAPAGIKERQFFRAVATKSK